MRDILVTFHRVATQEVTIRVTCDGPNAEKVARAHFAETGGAEIINELDSDLHYVGQEVVPDEPTHTVTRQSPGRWAPTPEFQSPAYRNAMRDAGRGHLLD